MYVEMVCKFCGMKGKRYGFEVVEVSGNYKLENVMLCPKAPKVEPQGPIRIIRCGASGKAFGNLTPGSIHDICIPPGAYKNDHTGVWVMGVGEPVKLLTGEFQNL